MDFKIELLRNVFLNVNYNIKIKSLCSLACALIANFLVSQHKEFYLYS